MNFKAKNNNKILFFYFIFICFLYPNQNIIKVINYNIHGLSPILTKDKNSDRIKFIFKNISKKYDLILFQENWVYQNLLSEYFHDYTIIIGEDEIVRKVGIIKNMSSGDQIEVPLDTIHKHFDIVNNGSK